MSALIDVAGISSAAGALSALRRPIAFLIYYISGLAQLSSKTSAAIVRYVD